MTQAEKAVLAQERRALDEWARGALVRFTDVDAEDATYFDDIGAQRRLDGLRAIRSYMSSMEGKIPPHRYEVVDPKVQVYGDVAVLTLRYEPSTADGNPLQVWKATSVYRRADGEWRRVHAHWSMVKDL
jgi:ketosteroid isomerase-like protein